MNVQLSFRFFFFYCIVFQDENIFESQSPFPQSVQNFPFAVAPHFEQKFGVVDGWVEQRGPGGTMTTRNHPKTY